MAAIWVVVDSFFFSCLWMPQLETDFSSPNSILYSTFSFENWFLFYDRMTLLNIFRTKKKYPNRL